MGAVEVNNGGDSCNEWGNRMGVMEAWATTFKREELKSMTMA